jgi:hypothetical protein
MVLIYGEALSNADATRRLYVYEEISQSPSSLSTYFCECCPAFKGLWDFYSCPVDEEPDVSCRRLPLRIDVSSFTIWRTRHEQGLHPYHLQHVQHLKSEDPPRRIAFCQWLLQ